MDYHVITKFAMLYYGKINISRELSFLTKVFAQPNVFEGNMYVIDYVSLVEM